MCQSVLGRVFWVKNILELASMLLIQKLLVTYGFPENSSPENSEMTKDDIAKAIMNEYGFGHLIERQESSLRNAVELCDENKNFDSFSSLSKRRLQDIHSKIVSKLEELKSFKARDQERLALEIMKGYGFGDIVEDSTLQHFSSADSQKENRREESQFNTS